MYEWIKRSWLAKLVWAVWIIAEAMYYAGRYAAQDAIWWWRAERRWRRIAQEFDKRQDVE